MDSSHISVILGDDAHNLLGIFLTIPWSVDLHLYAASFTIEMDNSDIILVKLNVKYITWGGLSISNIFSKVKDWPDT